VGDEYGALFRTTNLAVDFTRLALPSRVARPAVGVPLDNPSVVIVADGLGAGAWRSTDKGETFSELSTLIGVAVKRFVPEPSNPSWLYALAGADAYATGPDGGSAQTGLWLSTNQGETFLQVAFASETVHDVTYVDSTHIAATERGLLKATTGGVSTSLTDDDLPLLAVAADPAQNGAYLVATVDGGIQRVVGGTLSTLTGVTGPWVAGGLITRGTEVLALSMSGLYRGVPDGGPGVDASSHPVSALAALLTFTQGTTPSSVLALRSAEQGVALSFLGSGVQTALGPPQGSLVWRSSSTGLRSAHRCPSMSVSATRTLVGCVVETADGPAARVFSGSEPDVLSEEASLGSPHPLPTAAGPVAVTIAADGTRYAALGSLRQQAASGGAWSEVSAENAFFVSAHPRISGMVVVGVMRSDDVPQVYVSSSGGASLGAISGTRGLAPAKAIFHPTNDLVAWIIAAPEQPWLSQTPPDLERGLWQTTDGFSTLVAWGPTLTPPERITALALSPADPLTLVALTSQGRTFQSANDGASWTAAGALDSLLVTSVLAVPNRNGVLFAGGIPLTDHAPLRLSVDNGASWQPVDASLPAILELAVHPDAAGTLLLATAGQGIWQLKEGESSSGP
jgi:hypothetical protein